MNDESMPEVPEGKQSGSATGSLASLEGESPAAYDGFMYYFEMPLPRSLKKAASELGASLNTLEDWSTKYKWQKRIQDYRAHLAKQREQADAAVIQWQEKAAETSLRLLFSSGHLLEQQLLRGADKIPVQVILRMMQVSDDLARPRRGEKGMLSANKNHEALRKQLMEVGEFARQQRKLEANRSSGNASTQHPDSPEKVQPSGRVQATPQAPVTPSDNVSKPSTNNDKP
jgi:hypothetical protein